MLGANQSVMNSCSPSMSGSCKRVFLEICDNSIQGKRVVYLIPKYFKKIEDVIDDLRSRFVPQGSPSEIVLATKTGFEFPRSECIDAIRDDDSLVLFVSNSELECASDFHHGGPKVGHVKRTRTSSHSASEIIGSQEEEDKRNLSRNNSKSESTLAKSGKKRRSGSRYLKFDDDGIPIPVSEVVRLDQLDSSKMNSIDRKKEKRKGSSTIPLEISLFDADNKEKHQTSRTELGETLGNSQLNQEGKHKWVQLSPSQIRPGDRIRFRTIELVDWEPKESLLHEGNVQNVDQECKELSVYLDGGSSMNLKFEDLSHLESFEYDQSKDLTCKETQGTDPEKKISTQRSRSAISKKSHSFLHWTPSSRLPALPREIQQALDERRKQLSSSIPSIPNKINQTN